MLGFLITLMDESPLCGTDVFCFVPCMKQWFLLFYFRGGVGLLGGGLWGGGGLVGGAFRGGWGGAWGFFVVGGRDWVYFGGAWRRGVGSGGGVGGMGGV